MSARVAHGIDGFIKNLCSDVEELGMQCKDMGGVGQRKMDEGIWWKSGP